MSDRPTPLTDLLDGEYLYSIDESRARAFLAHARRLERDRARLAEALRAFVSAGITTGGRVPDRNGFRTDLLGPIFEQARAALASLEEK